MSALMLWFDSEHDALRATCGQHDVAGCELCNKVHGECSFGACLAAATILATVRHPENGRALERRPCCAEHAPIVRDLNGSRWPTTLASGCAMRAERTADEAAGRTR